MPLLQIYSCMESHGMEYRLALGYCILHLHGILSCNNDFILPVGDIVIQLINLKLKYLLRCASMHVQFCGPIIGLPQCCLLCTSMTSYHQKNGCRLFHVSGAAKVGSIRNGGFYSVGREKEPDLSFILIMSFRYG